MGDPKPWGLAVRKGWFIVVGERRSPVCSSPGPGSAGSYELKKALERLRSLCPTCGEGRPRFEVTEERRESSCWMPALMVAAAARDEDEALGEGE